MAHDRRPYHHGNLRRALLDAAVDVIGEVGPAAMSMREVARRAEVSSAAPTHHFGDKAGLLTAVATEGYELLAEALAEEHARSGSFLEVGVAYVRFALDHRAHFEVMFRPELLRHEDPDLTAKRAATSSMLYGPAAETSGTKDASPHARDAGIAAWALVHGLATLMLDGNLPPDALDDHDALARRVASFLFRAAT